MYSIDPTIQFWFWQMRRLLADCRTVLDLGCGESRLCQKLGKVSTGVDAWTDASANHISFFKADLMDWLRGDMTKYDAVIALDVIEHLAMREGSKMLSLMEARARKVVILYTPNGYIEQGENGGNPYQRHLSGWEAQDFRSRGYEVHGALCHAAYKDFPILRMLTVPFIRNHPEAAASLLAVKTLTQ